MHSASATSISRASPRMGGEVGVGGCHCTEHLRKLLTTVTSQRPRLHWGQNADNEGSGGTNFLRLQQKQVRILHVSCLLALEEPGPCWDKKLGLWHYVTTLFFGKCQFSNPRRETWCETLSYGLFCSLKVIQLPIPKSACLKTSTQDSDSPPLSLPAPPQAIVPQCLSPNLLVSLFGSVPWASFLLCVKNSSKEPALPVFSFF